MKHGNGYRRGTLKGDRSNDNGCTRPGPTNRIQPESDKWNNYHIPVQEMQSERKNKLHHQWLPTISITPV